MWVMKETESDGCTYHCSDVSICFWKNFPSEHQLRNALKKYKIDISEEHLFELYVDHEYWMECNHGTYGLEIEQIKYEE